MRWCCMWPRMWWWGRGSELRGPKAAARFRFPKTGIVPAVLILCGGIWWWLSRTPDSVYRRTPGMREPSYRRACNPPVIRRGSRAWPIPGSIRQSQLLGAIGDAPGVPAPYVGIRNEMASASRPISYACDTSFGAVQSNKYQVDLIPAGFCLADQVHPVAAGKGRLDRITHSRLRYSAASVSEKALRPAVRTASSNWALPKS